MRWLEQHTTTLEQHAINELEQRVKALDRDAVKEKFWFDFSKGK